LADWVTISALATAGGTFALAATTYASVRSANRAARAAETSMLAQLRPLMIPSSQGDTEQRIGFGDGVGLTVPGGGAAVEIADGNVYVGISIRNVGPGIGVLHGGRVSAEARLAGRDHAPLEEFRLLRRDIYVPPGKVSFWQIAFRDSEDAERNAMREAVESGGFTVDLLYGDYEGGQRVISRFRVLREDDGAWIHTALRHWQIDRSDPR
jgi:hypothetical protein